MTLSLFAQGKQTQQPSAPKIQQMQSGYNAPAGVEVMNPYSFYLMGGFTYWQPMQENMELGIVSSPDSVKIIDGSVTNLGFQYAPGFQLGVGYHLDRDDWDIYSQYTWFRGSSETSVNLDPSGSAQLIPMWLIPTSSVRKYLGGRERWNLHFDLIDLQMSRDYYIGSLLTLRPFLGARSALFRQYLRAVYLDESTGFSPHTHIVSQKSHSWGVGPRVGVTCDWDLGRDFGLYGMAACDVLYTQYTKLSFQQQRFNSNNVLTQKYLISQHNLNYLRPSLDLEIGFNWDTYFYQERYHVDFALGYEFQVFFGQNMFRNFLDDTTQGKSISPNGNLFVQGLNAKVQFDF
jgi:hypothetical protein